MSRGRACGRTAGVRPHMEFLLGRRGAGAGGAGIAILEEHWHLGKVRILCVGGLSAARMFSYSGPDVACQHQGEAQRRHWPLSASPAPPSAGPAKLDGSWRHLRTADFAVLERPEIIGIREKISTRLDVADPEVVPEAENRKLSSCRTRNRFVDIILPNDGVSPRDRPSLPPTVPRRSSRCSVFNTCALHFTGSSASRLSCISGIRLRPASH